MQVTGKLEEAQRLESQATNALKIVMENGLAQELESLQKKRDLKEADEEFPISRSDIMVCLDKIQNLLTYIRDATNK